jgi:hypothetical protein
MRTRDLNLLFNQTVPLAQQAEAWRRWLLPRPKTHRLHRNQVRLPWQAEQVENHLTPMQQVKNHPGREFLFPRIIQRAQKFEWHQQ